MADNNKKRLDTSNFPIYRSKKTNRNNGETTYKAGTGLHVSEDARKVIGNEGVNKISKDVGIGDNKISTGGGDPLPKGSKNNQFLVAENKEEAEEMRERTDGKIPVRTLQYRDEDGQFSNSPEEIEGRVKEKVDEDKDYIQKASGLSDDEFVERIKSIGMTKEEFISEVSRAISSVSRNVVDKNKLMKYLKEERGLNDKQASRIYGDRKYGLKDSKDLKNEDARIKYYEIMNENKAKANDPSRRMKKYWRKRKQSDAMKERIAQNEQIGKQENKSEDNYKKVISEVNPDLKGYSQDEIDAAKEKIQAAHLYNPDVIKAEDVNNTALIKSEIDKARAKKGGQ